MLKYILKKLFTVLTQISNVYIYVYLLYHGVGILGDRVHDRLQIICVVLWIEEVSIHNSQNSNKANPVGYYMKQLTLANTLKLYRIELLMHFPELETHPVQ